MAGSINHIDLLEKTRGPRIILIGGSNVAFSLDAELMQSELGIPVINNGLHIGLGIAPLKELEQHIQPGDTIIISLEYELFTNQSFRSGNPRFLAEWVEYDPSRFIYLSDPFVMIPTVYTKMVQGKINRAIETSLNGGSLASQRGIYQGLASFDNNGDFIGHLQEPSQPPKKIPPDPFPVIPLQDEMFKVLEDFHQTALTKGAIVYFEAPASREINCIATGKTELKNFFNEFEKRSDIPLLTQFNQVCLPDAYFFDTQYHLNVDGRKIKTTQLIKNLLKTGNLYINN